MVRFGVSICVGVTSCARDEFWRAFSTRLCRGIASETGRFDSLSRQRHNALQISFCRNFWARTSASRPKARRANLHALSGLLAGFATRLSTRRFCWQTSCDGPSPTRVSAFRHQANAASTLTHPVRNRAMEDTAQTAPAATEPAAPAVALEAPKTVSNEELERRVIGTLTRSAFPSSALGLSPLTANIAAMAPRPPTEIVRTGDLQTLSTKRIRLQLEAELGLYLTDRKQDIDAMVLRALEAATAAAAAESTPAPEPAPANGDDDDVDEPVDLDDAYGRNGRRRVGKKDAAVASPASSSEPESDEALARRLQMEEMRPRRAAAVVSSRKSKLAESKPFKKSSSSAAGKERSSPKRPGAGISAEMVLSPALAELMGQTEVRSACCDGIAPVIDANAPAAWRNHSSRGWPHRCRAHRWSSGCGSTSRSTTCRTRWTSAASFATTSCGLSSTATASTCSR